MGKRIVIVGAVALGPKVACRLRRLDPEAEITVVDRDSLISYGGCGIPYYVGGDIPDIEGLCSTSSHALRDPEFFRRSKGVDILPRVEALGIDRQAKKLQVRHLDTGKEESLDYDKLVIATGATPFKPPIPGADFPMVFTVSNLHSARDIKEKISKGQVEKAVVIGAGAIGIEMAEALTDLWGIETTVVEMADQVLPAALGKNMSRIIENQLEKNDVKVMLSEKVEEIVGDPESGVTAVRTGSGTLDCDMVVMSAGVRPNTLFAKESGLACGRSGALLVDRGMRTTDPHIYAGGDCVELRNLVNGENMTMPLGSLANRQGRIIANNIYGRASKFKGTVGTFCIKVFDMAAAKAGLTFAQARDIGYDPVHSLVAQPDRAHFYPASKLMYIHLIADRKTRKILGIEAIGSQGDAVKSRVDSVAPLLQAGIDVDEVCVLETGYAPPFASAMDIINNAGNVLDNILEGKNITMDPVDFIRAFEKNEIQVLDVRDQNEIEPFIKKYGKRWMNIPQAELRDRLDEVPGDRPVCLVCGTGARSYECQVLLSQNGFDNICNVQGGHAMLLATAPKFV
ncbi:FAD-dependent oxidoreductase [Desulfospira joergensenii]|uniref:FAD-dependent oxidoreductase n=1 Tax=Desulfospira joergensenii TaxID=53329 RepID=UPI0003B4582B|nr:FAD-dependent oxidoreductase [Desulfospira joergensenii]